MRVTCCVVTAGMTEYKTRTLPPLRPSDSNITAAIERNHFAAKLRKLWNIPSSVTHFPAPHPVSLERRHYPALRDDCIVSLKTDGVRYLLLLCMDRNGEPVALMIDRAMKMFEIEVWANNEYFEKGTLFDGELVWEQETQSPRLAYIIFDVVCLSGESCIQLSYSERLDRINGVVGDLPGDMDELCAERMITEQNSIVAMRNPHFLRLALKKCVRLSNLRELWASRMDCHHRNDGLVITSNNSPLDINTSTSMYKWKACHTVDVLVDGGVPHVQVGAAIEPLSSLSHGARKLGVVLDHNQVCQTTEAVVVECECNISSDTLTLFPLKRRFDKTTPNSLTTLERTLTNITEAIQMHELIEEFCAASPDKRQRT